MWPPKIIRLIFLPIRFFSRNFTADSFICGGECHRPWYIGRKVSRYISRFANIALCWCKRWQTVTRIFRHITTDDDRRQSPYVVRRTTYYTSIPTWNSHQLISERYQKISFRNLCNHMRSHGRNLKDPATRTYPSYVDSGTGGKIHWGGTEHHLRKCARMYEKRVESYALHIPRGCTGEFH
jgi:hypothetical protein